MDTFKNQYLRFFMWFFPLLFFAYQFILRLWPGLMMNQIISQFEIDYSQFGMLAAFYYYGYASMQIPIAMMIDRFGVRKIVTIFALICGLATLIFTYTTNFYLALLSRTIIGIGSSVGILGVSKVISEWFDKDQYAKMIGFSFTLGLTGMIFGGKPTSLMIEKYQWHNVATILGFLSIAIGCVSYIFLRSPKKSAPSKEHIQTFDLSGLKSILSSKLTWCIALSSLLMVGALEGFADVWGIQYLVTTYHIEKSNAAGIISFIPLGMLFGGPLLALLSQKIGSHYLVISFCGFGMALIFIFLLINATNNSIVLSLLFISIGIMCCYQSLIFAVGAELVSSKNLGICIALLNSVNMLGGSLYHTVIGKIMDLSWSGAVSDIGLRVYTLKAYKYSLSIIPACSFLGAIIILLIGLRLKNRLEVITTNVQHNQSFNT